MRLTESELRLLIQDIIQEKKRPKPKVTLWDAIRAKRARGEKPAKPGDDGYPSDETWSSATSEADTNETNRVQEAFYHHLNERVGVDKNIFRPGSTAFFALFREARQWYHEGLYQPRTLEEVELLDSDVGEFALYEGRLVPLDYPIMEGNEEHLNEAEYKGRKVELNKPKRGEGGKAYVYVNSGKKTKDGKIRGKKVPFGSSMPDAMGDSDEHKKRRKNFGDRHNCADKKDKTKPGYWSCRATKFFGRDIAGWW